MIYNLNPELQQPVRDMVKEIGPEIEKMGRECDRKPDGFSFEIFKILAGKGFVGFSMPEEYGGGGKTALLAAWMRRWRQNHPDVFSFEHYFGATPESSNVSSFIMRLLGELKSHYGIMDEIPSCQADH